MPYNRRSPDDPYVSIPPRRLARGGGRDLRHLGPPVDPSHLDPPGGEQAKEEHLRGLGVGERPLSLDPPAKLPMQPLDAVGRAERLPLAFGEAVEGQQLVSGLQQTLGHLGGQLAPLRHEAPVCVPGLRPVGRIDDAMVVSLPFLRPVLGRMA